MNRNTFHTLTEARNFLKDYLTVPPFSYPEDYNIEAIIDQAVKETPQGYYFCACPSAKDKQLCSPSEVLCHDEFSALLKHHTLS